MPHLRGSRRPLWQTSAKWDAESGETVEHSASWVCGGMRAIADYFNRADVQKAIHVSRTTKWTPNDDALEWKHPEAGISFLGFPRPVSNSIFRAFCLSLFF